MSKILVVVAHPDDEVLGCGGTIARYSQEHEVHCIVLGEGVMGRIDSSLSDLDVLSEQNEKAAKILGIKETKRHFHPDNAFDRQPLLSYIHTIESDLKRIGDVDYVLTHFPDDLNVDHRMTSQAVQTAFRPQLDMGCKALLFFETLSSTEWGHSAFWPSLYVDVSGTVLDLKLRAFKCYKSEVRKAPHPRSEHGIIALARKRGMEVGFEEAEAFVVKYMKVEGIE